MPWAYLLVFNAEVGSRAEVQEFLDNIPEVTYWYGCMPHCVFLTSTLPASEIAQKVGLEFGKESGQRFLVVEVHDDRQGWLPKEVWHVLGNPENPRLEND